MDQQETVMTPTGAPRPTKMLGSFSTLATEPETPQTTTGSPMLLIMEFDGNKPRRDKDTPPGRLVRRGRRRSREPPAGETTGGSTNEDMSNASDSVGVLGGACRQNPQPQENIHPGASGRAEPDFYHALPPPPPLLAGTRRDLACAAVPPSVPAGPEGGLRFCASMVSEITLPEFGLTEATSHRPGQHTGDESEDESPGTPGKCLLKTGTRLRKALPREQSMSDDDGSDCDENEERNHPKSNSSPLSRRGVLLREGNFRAPCSGGRRQLPLLGGDGDARPAEAVARRVFRFQI